MSTTHKRKRNGLFYSRGEETVNSLSHGIGISMAVIIGGFFLMKCYRAQDPWAILGMWLYLFGMGGSYLSSTLYHSVETAVAPLGPRGYLLAHCRKFLSRYADCLAR